MDRTPCCGAADRLGAMVACGPAMAQSYPSKDVKLIVPFPPGGVTDLNARILAKHLSKFWKQPVTVTNMPGGGGTKGTMFVLGSAKDGYTMMMSATGQATQNPAIDSKLPYKWDEPTLVARTSISPLVFVVKGDSPWRSLREVVDDVKKDPAKYQIRHVRSGRRRQHRAVAPVRQQRRRRAEARPRRAAGRRPLLDAVATGETHFAAQYLAEMGPQLASKKLKALAVSTRARQAAAGYAHLAGGGLRHVHADRMERDRRPSQLPADIVGSGTKRSRRSPPTRRSSRRPKRRAPKSPISTRSGSRHAQDGIRDGGAAGDEAGVAEIADWPAKSERPSVAFTFEKTPSARPPSE